MKPSILYHNIPQTNATESYFESREPHLGFGHVHVSGQSLLFASPILSHLHLLTWRNGKCDAHLLNLCP